VLLVLQLGTAYRDGRAESILTDILYAVDDGGVSVLALLDLSAAFDTVDHDILLTRLKVSFGIRGAALDWFQSYLSNRVECVRHGSVRSTQKIVRFGVPQGSVLGPYCSSCILPA